MSVLGHGVEICTTATRPASAPNGTLIFDTDVSQLMLKVGGTWTPITYNIPLMSGQIGTTSGPITSGQKIPFGEFWTQQGITWDSPNRRFYVPIAGKYRVTMNPFFQTAYGAGRVYIGKNNDAPGGSNHFGHCYRESATYDTVSLNSIIAMNANDYIVFYIAGGALYNNPVDRFNQFTIQYISN